jgi:TetR/AcrR family transcriptional regulator, mexJK operon transcriptional repressor
VGTTTTSTSGTGRKRLFTEIISMDIEEAEQRSRALVDALSGSEDVEKDLRDLARRHVSDVLRPHLVQLRRIVIAEADRFPDLAQAWYARGPERAATTLAERFTALAGRGHLRMEDPVLAAQHFNWLVLSIPLNHAMFHPVDTQFTPRQLCRFADEAVRVFSAAYGS